MSTRTYHIETEVVQGKTYYTVIDDSTDMQAHSGAFFAREAAEDAMQRICWGETIIGDIDI